MLKFGRITEIDTSKVTGRVHLDGEEIVSNWLPISVLRSKGDQLTFPFAVNEHVWCLMDENCEYGVIGGAIFDNKNSPSEAAQKRLVIRMSNGSQITFDGNDGTLTINCTGDVEAKGQKVSIEGAAQVEIKSAVKVSVTAPAVDIDSAAVKVTGALVVTGGVIAATISTTGGGAIETSGTLKAATIETTGDVKAGTVSLTTHIHTSASPGNPTSPPVP